MGKKLYIFFIKYRYYNFFIFNLNLDEVITLTLFKFMKVIMISIRYAVMPPTKYQIF